MYHKVPSDIRPLEPHRKLVATTNSIKRYTRQCQSSEHDNKGGCDAGTRFGNRGGTGRPSTAVTYAPDPRPIRRVLNSSILEFGTPKFNSVRSFHCRLAYRLFPSTANNGWCRRCTECSGMRLRALTAVCSIERWTIVYYRRYVADMTNYIVGATGFTRNLHDDLFEISFFLSFCYLVLKYHSVGSI